MNTPSKEIELTVITPMYNEESCIRNNIETIVSHLKALGIIWELIVVNDGSTDGSKAIVEEAASRNPNVSLISYSQNRGRGYALRRGFQATTGKYIVTTESDLSWGPEIIEKLYRSLKDDDCDVVIASPFIEGGRHENVPFKRRLLSKLGNKLLKFAVHGKLTMLSGMTRGYRAEVIRFLDLEADGKEIHLEIISKCLDLGYRINEIPAVLRWSESGTREERRASSFQAQKLILSHLAFAFYQSPIILIGSIALGLFLCGSAIGLYLIYLPFIQGAKIGGRPLLIYMLLFVLVGLITLIFCFLANQNREIIKQINILSSKLNRVQQKNIRKDERS